MKKTKVGQDLIAGLTEAIAHARGTITLRSSFEEIPDGPRSFTAEELKEIRSNLHMSQSVMAAYMGVKAQTVRSWEQGQRKPDGTARRLFELIVARPKFVTDVIMHKAKEKKA